MFAEEFPRCPVRSLVAIKRDRVREPALILECSTKKSFRRRDIALGAQQEIDSFSKHPGLIPLKMVVGSKYAPLLLFAPEPGAGRVALHVTAVSWRKCAGRRRGRASCSRFGQPL